MEDNNIEHVKQNNFFVYILLFCLILFMAVVGVILAQYEVIPKDDFRQEYIKKSDVSFESLPTYVKENYIEKYKCNTSVKTKIIEVEKIVTEVKTVEIEKEVEKIVEVEKLVEQNIFAKSNYKVAKCYDMLKTQHYLSNNCEKNIATFLKKNKDAKYFEVIGIVAHDDFVLLNKLKKNKDVLIKLNVTDKKLTYLQNQAHRGLSKKRVEEVSWFIKKTLGMNTKILPVNYFITSKKANKGAVVRVYY